MQYGLEKYKMDDLRIMAREMGLPSQRTKADLIKVINLTFDEYVSYKNNKIDRYTRIQQIGEKGKEGTTYLVEDKDQNQYAMKTFRSSKSAARLIKEYSLQFEAAKKGVAPKVYDYDPVSKFIVMDLMDEHLFNGRRITRAYQEEILGIYAKLDRAKVLHNDTNLLNFMLKGGKIYLIDYGFAKKIDDKVIKQMGSSTPNSRFMPISLVLKLHEKGYPTSSFKYFLKHISSDDKIKFGLDKIEKKSGERKKIKC
jgi:tRNA A-37 threonylcarbamoyl transferase component Bud32